MDIPVDFTPFPGITSPDLQMIFAQYCIIGEAPPSVSTLINLEDGDKLCCQVSTPTDFTKGTPTIVLIHGLGGSESSGYMVRLSRHLYKAGYKVVRVNLRGCGSGKGLITKPYHGGTSQDILSVLKVLKEQSPDSPNILIGYSLGGNIAIKLCGELGNQGDKYIQYVIAICPTLDLYNSATLIQKDRNWIYLRYYLKYLLEQTKQWNQGIPISSITEHDEKVTAIKWNFKNAMDYYTKSSSIHYLSNVKVPCDLLFAQDDPFIDLEMLKNVDIPPCVRIMVTRYGSHMGFLGHPSRKHGFLWLTGFLMELIESHYKKNK